MARALIHMPETAQARRGDRDPRADRPPDGDRLPARRRRPGRAARHHPHGSPAATTARRCSAPSCIRPSPPIPTSRSIPSPPRAARSNSTGKATTASRRPRRRTMTVTSHDAARGLAGAAAAWCWPGAAASPAADGRTRGMSSGSMFIGESTRRCSATIRRTRPCCGCRTGRRCGTRARRRDGERPAPAATASRRRACAASRRATRRSTRRRAASVNLGQRIDQCRADRQQAAPLPPRARTLLGTRELRGAAVARHAGRAAAGRRARGRCRERGRGAVLPAHRPAQPVLRPVPRPQLRAASSPARRSPGPCQRAIRSTGWNGRRWARCSGGCATA